MNFRTIRWKDSRVELIDQRLLPNKLVYSKCTTAKNIIDAIRNMKVRGAPAIGVAGAYGVYLGVRNSKARTFKAFRKELNKVIKRVAAARPTAQNLFWAVERMEETAMKNKSLPISGLKKVLLKEANKILDEDIKICRQIGLNGSGLIKKGSTVLTHCNAGGLATGGYGTALGVIYSAGKKIKKVFVDETRPVLQGARLTAWELTKSGINAVLICDNMAASIMAKGKIDAVIVGADRIAANGDTANKIGTYNLAVLAEYHRIPFYVAAPFSTFDLSMKSGKEIPIEERSSSEIKKIGKKYIAPKKIKIENPAFDVTPKDLISAIITEKCVIRRPDAKKIRSKVIV